MKVHRCDNCYSIIEDFEPRVRAGSKGQGVDYCGGCWRIATDAMHESARHAEATPPWASPPLALAVTATA